MPQAETARRALDPAHGGANSEAPFYEAKLEVGRFFMARVLPRPTSRA